GLDADVLEQIAVEAEGEAVAHGLDVDVLAHQNDMGVREEAASLLHERLRGHGLRLDQDQPGWAFLGTDLRGEAAQARTVDDVAEAPPAQQRGEPGPEESTAADDRDRGQLQLGMHRNPLLATRNTCGDPYAGPYAPKIPQGLTAPSEAMITLSLCSEGS